VIAGETALSVRYLLAGPQGEKVRDWCLGRRCLELQDQQPYHRSEFSSFRAPKIASGVLVEEKKCLDYPAGNRRTGRLQWLQVIDHKRPSTLAGAPSLLLRSQALRSRRNWGADSFGTNPVELRQLRRWGGSPVHLRLETLSRRSSTMYARCARFCDLSGSSYVCFEMPYDTTTA
jgi:hypothetical protein